MLHHNTAAHRFPEHNVSFSFSLKDNLFV
uniref:Uncharacterized protein n=1 Tax=Rhizophora mucronata TaxID=61149 RepID=A0A2P2PED8_RHIMU